MTAIFCAFLASCYIPDMPKLQQEIDQLALVGTPTVTALTTLGAAGFICAGNNPINCGRSKYAYIIATCSQGFSLYSDQTGKVTKIEVKRIRCMGFP